MTEETLPLAEVIGQFGHLCASFPSTCPEATDAGFTSASVRIDMRWRHVDLILGRIDADIDRLQQARHGSIAASQIDALIAAPSLDVETLYTVLRSHLDDVATLTPCFYSHTRRRGLKRSSLREQLAWYRTHSELDQAMTDYALNQTQWFDTLKDVRDDVIHHRCGILVSNSGDVTADGDVAVDYAVFDASGFRGVPEGLESGIYSTLKSVLSFMHFYTHHFAVCAHSDWPSYGRPHWSGYKWHLRGLSSLKRWTATRSGR